MKRPTLTGSKNSKATTNGSGQRQCPSWIESFVEHTSNLESAPIFRKWSAISAIAATLEQKVWTTTSSPLYPNLYVFLVGNAGIGKTRPIMAAMSFVKELPEPHLGATSMTMASLTDYLNEAKRQIVLLPDPAIQYNSLYIIADELSAFMNEYDNSLIPGLTTFYDVVPYSQGRRTSDLRIKIERPQLNILSGSTPSNLMRFIPEFAWEQGFTSRVIMIYSDEQPKIDVFNTPHKKMPREMLHDLDIINKLHGQFGWTEEYATAMHNWKELDYVPRPDHPKLAHYNSRRFAHMIKLSMVACVDRGNELQLTKADFNKAMGWLLEAELNMPGIFKGGAGGSDSKAMDEILHFVHKAGEQGVTEQRVVNFARMHIQYANQILNILEVMEKSGQIQKFNYNPKTGVSSYRAV